jgi:hypothetical protein
LGGLTALIGLIIHFRNEWGSEIDVIAFKNILLMPLSPEENGFPIESQESKENNQTWGADKIGLKEMKNQSDFPWALPPS